jgi:hypothetical protein
MRQDSLDSRYIRKFFRSNLGRLLNQLREKKGYAMTKKNKVRGGASVLCAISLACCSIALAPRAGQAQQEKKGGTASKETRWEGRVERSSKEKSTLTVRKTSSNLQKDCAYDSSTKWVSQYHANKKINNIDPAEVKDNDYVICKGAFDKSGVFHATLISKRLSHSH